MCLYESEKSGVGWSEKERESLFYVKDREGGRKRKRKRESEIERECVCACVCVHMAPIRMLRRKKRIFKVTEKKEEGLK